MPRRLAGQAMAVICASRAAAAGVAPPMSHDLRRTYISGLRDAGAAIAVVQRFARRGRASSRSGAGYGRTPIHLTVAAQPGVGAISSGLRTQAGSRGSRQRSGVKTRLRQRGEARVRAAWG